MSWQDGLSPEFREHPLIEFKSVSKVYGRGQARVSALVDVDMKIMKGEFTAIMGPSGSGKSTAMNILGCLDTPTHGSYLFKGVSVGKLSRNKRALLRRLYLGFVFQGFNLLSRTSAIENVELPLIYRGLKSKKRQEAAAEALSKVGLADRGRHSPAELSGGQQQRVAIARALVTEPSVLLADEPTGNLDSTRSREIMELLTSLNSDLGLTIIMVTHEDRMAAYADRIIRFLDGRIESKTCGQEVRSCS
jgi:ABC-type lipoprotein export system ATPase subunit